MKHIFRVWFIVLVAVVVFNHFRDRRAKASSKNLMRGYHEQVVQVQPNPRRSSNSVVRRRVIPVPRGSEKMANQVLSRSGVSTSWVGGAVKTLT